MNSQLSQERLEEFLSDIRDEPSWRVRADNESDYYDGNQLDGSTLRDMEDRGVAPLIRNLIGPAVDLVLGMEAKNRRDWKCIGEATDEDADFAEALNVKLKLAERTSEADHATSEAYASQVKAGIGWVEVARESDPFEPDYRIQSVHRREIWWDWRAKRRDLKDGRYLVRKAWYDLDVATLAFPSHAQRLKNIVHQIPIWDQIRADDATIALAQDFDVELRTSLEAAEWRDADRNRIALYEVWYRVYAYITVLRLPGGRVVEYQPENPNQAAALASGHAILERALTNKLRLSWWAGPHRLADIPSPYPHNYFPYVPYWGYREDRTGIPYGLIRRMMSPQDEVNARLSKMMWLLSAKRVIADEDALAMPHKQVMDEVARPDAYILLNPNRKNKTRDAFQVDSDFQLSAQQFDVLKDATQTINDTSGIQAPMKGEDTRAESGIAINSLVEQGATTLAKINDNYRYARSLTGQLLLSLVAEDIGSKPTNVTIQKDGRKKVVVLNELKVDEVSGFQYRKNDMTALKMRVTLDDVPDTPSYRMQQLQMLTEVTKSLPPEMQTLMIDLYVRATDLPAREEVARRLATALGRKPDDMTPEEEAQYQAEQERKAEIEQLALDEQRAGIEKTRAEATYYASRSEKTEAETEKVEQDMALGVETHVMDVESRAVDNQVKLNPPPRPESKAKGPANKGKTAKKTS